MAAPLHNTKDMRSRRYVADILGLALLAAMSSVLWPPNSGTKSAGDSAGLATRVSAGRPQSRSSYVPAWPAERERRAEESGK